MKWATGVGGKYFYRRQEVQQLLAVLQSIDNSNDKVALVAALRSPFFGSLMKICSYFMPGEEA